MDAYGKKMSDDLAFEMSGHVLNGLADRNVNSKMAIAVLFMGLKRIKDEIYADDEAQRKVISEVYRQCIELMEGEPRG